MRTALRRPQRGRLLHADEHLALFLYVIDLLNSPAIAQRQYLVKHFFGNHGSARIKANSLTHYKRRGTCKVNSAVDSIMFPRNRNLENYLRMHRKRAEFSQEEVAFLLGS